MQTKPVLSCDCGGNAHWRKAQDHSWATLFYSLLSRWHNFHLPYAEEEGSLSLQPLTHISCCSRSGCGSSTPCGLLQSIFLGLCEPIPCTLRWSRWFPELVLRCLPAEAIETDLIICTGLATHLCMQWHHRTGAAGAIRTG